MSVGSSLDRIEGFDIYMARVGQSAAMAEGRIAGNLLDDNPLSPQGVLDAEGAGETLVKTLKAGNIDKVEIYSADQVLRMKQTTDLIIKKLEEARIAYTRHSDESLGGRNHGILNGLSQKERQENPVVVKQKEERETMSSEARFATPPKGGESKQDLVDKISKFFQSVLKEQSSSKPIVVITSNNTIGALTAILNKDAPYQKVQFDYHDILQLRQTPDRLELIKHYKA